MKKKNIVLLVGVIVIVLIILGLIRFIRGKSLDTNTTLVNNLYSYIGSNDLEVCRGLVMYDEDTVTQESLGDETLLCMAYNLLDDDVATPVVIEETSSNNTCSLDENIIFATDDYEDDECSITKIDYDTMNEQYKTMYGTDIGDIESFKYNGSTICYYYDSAFYCGLSETYTYTIGAEPHSYRTIKRAYEKNDEIIIYDYMINVINDTCYTSYVGLTENSKCTDNYDSNNVNYSFLRKYGTLYKHTFNKDGDNYYWVKSEPVE